MLRKILFQLHWLAGITAGVVLALVGLSGAVLSLERPVIEHLEARALAPPADAARLPPGALLASAARAFPGERIAALTLRRDGPAVVQLAPPPGARRGPAHRLDPYTGARLPPLPAERFFHTVEALHRNLLAGPAGKQVVGASTAVLLALALSGLYLRWPRRFDLRAWLGFDRRARGVHLLRELHAAAGTWLAVVYLLVAATGLFWSYAWYRNALFDLAGVTPPAFGAPGGAREQAGAAPAVDLDAQWAAFDAAVPTWREATARLPGPGAAMRFDYVDTGAPHTRARSTLALEVSTGAVREHDRFADRPLGARLMASMLALHSGEYFGRAGWAVVMLASVLMPAFAVTGWLLYLRRRARRRPACAPGAAPG